MKRYFKERREVNSGEICIETAGYRPLGVIVHSLELAGQQLAMSRMEEFVYGEDDKIFDAEISAADQEFIDNDPDSLLDLHDQLLLSIPKESGDKSGVDRSEQDREGTEPEVVSDSE